MDRKGIIAIALSLIFLVFWHYKTNEEIRAYQAQQAEAQATVTPEATPGASPTPFATTPAPQGETPATTPAAVEEKEEVVSSPVVNYTFTNLGGGIAQAELTQHKGQKDDAPLVINTHTSHPIGAILSQPGDTAQEPYTVSVNGNVVTATRTEANGLEITKTFTLPTEDKGAAGYLVDLKITFANRGAAPLEKAGYYLFAGSIEPLHASEYSYHTGFDWYRNGDTERVDVEWFAAKSLFGFQRQAARDQYHETPGSGIEWAGVKGQYFTSIISAKATEGTSVAASRFPITVEDKDLFGIQGSMGMPGFKLAPGETATHEVNLFVGPKAYTLLKQLPHYETEIMHFGIFKLICIALLRAMTWLYGFLGSYAWAIIVLTFIVRGALWPVQAKATRSMKQMSLLQPKMVELKEKYKDDPTRMNTEVMKLYKEHKVNPVAGCLPMLIQIPIFFGFYSMLGNAVELRNQPFLWISDLSVPDTVATIAGFPINILPLLMAGTMVLQMQLSPKSGDALQQRIMLFMPLMFVVFTYNFASALALYYTVQNILSIVQLYIMRNESAPKLEPAVPERKKKR